MQELSFRCAQLDLARQMETIPFIHRIMDLLAASGFNTLFLYLEDRIITRSYPFPAPEEGYTPEQIRELVAYAGSLHLELIPCVSTLGHAERFLRHSQMAGFAEVQGETTGRFGTTAAKTFCPSNPKVQDFLKNYLTEVAELFPGSYFHIGLDEFWDFDLCPRCRTLAPDFPGEEKLFLDHICRMRDILRPLGKRVVMWADMLDNYPDIIPDIPRDVVMAEWQYQRDVRSCQAHFNNSTNRNTLAVYEELGFDVLIAAIDESLLNIQSFMEYARPYSCVKGAFQTSWEKRESFWLRWFPLFAITGRLFQGKDTRTAIRETGEALFGVTDPQFLAALELACCNTMGRLFNLSWNGVIFNHPCGGNRDTQWNDHKLMLAIFADWKDKVTRGQDILDDLMNDIRKNILWYEIKRPAADILNFGMTGQRLNSLQGAMGRFLDLVRKLAADWDIIRPGITPNAFSQDLPVFEQNFKKSLAAMQRGTFIKIRFFHNDWCGMPKIAMSLKIAGQWTEAVDIPVRGDDHSQANTEVFYPLEQDPEQIQAVRLEHHGFGGIGVSYVELRKNGQAIRMPGKVLDTENDVVFPENVLTDDLRWCFLGSQNMQKTFRSREPFKIRHRIDIEFQDYIA